MATDYVPEPLAQAHDHAIQLGITPRDTSDR